MAHYSRPSKVVIDVPPADHDRELAFWSAAAGLPLTRFERHPEYHGAALHGQEFWLLVQRLDQRPARMHVDIHTDDLPAEIARLEELGAERIQRVHSWQVMRDPGGCGCVRLEDVRRDGTLRLRSRAADRVDLPAALSLTG